MLQAKVNCEKIVVYDSNAKITSGLLNGNVNQLGDFDMCLSVQSQDDVNGKYCLASMQFEAPTSPYLAALYRLVHSHFPFRSKLEDVNTTQTIHYQLKKEHTNFALARSSRSSILERQLGPLRPELLQRARCEKRAQGGDGWGSVRHRIPGAN